MLERKTRKEDLWNYVDLFNLWIPGHWFKVDKVKGTRILGRLRREAGSIVRKYTGEKVSGSKKKEMKKIFLTLSIKESELIIPQEIEDNLSTAK